MTKQTEMLYVTLSMIGIVLLELATLGLVFYKFGLRGLIILFALLIGALIWAKH